MGGLTDPAHGAAGMHINGPYNQQTETGIHRVHSYHSVRSRNVKTELPWWSFALAYVRIKQYYRKDLFKVPVCSQFHIRQLTVAGHCIICSCRDSKKD